MPLTCPLRIVPALYDAKTRLALPTLVDAWSCPHQAAPFATQMVWRRASGGLGRGLTRTLPTYRSRASTACAEILAGDTGLQAVLETHLSIMGRGLQTPLAAHAIYYPTAVGLIAIDGIRGVDAWHRGTIGRALRLICEPIERQAEAIARHDDHTVMTRDFGDAVRQYDAALADELRFPQVGALLSRDCRPAGSKTNGTTHQGVLL